MHTEATSQPAAQHAQPIEIVLIEPAGRPIPTDPAALLFQAEAAYLLGLSPRTLESFRLHGGGPSFVSISRGAVRYRRCDLDSWIASRIRKTTSDVGAAACAAGA